MNSDLTSKPLIVLKGLLFLACIILCSGLLVVQSPGIRTIFLVAVLVWSAARFYYFLFYVLHTYVDPTMKYSGIISLLRALRGRTQRPGSADR